MTIAKSILITSLFIIIWMGIGILIPVWNNAIMITPKIVFYELMNDLVTYSIFTIYFWFSIDRFSLGEHEIKIQKLTFIFVIITLAIGIRLFDLPFWEWKQLSNKYLNTAFIINNFSALKLSSFQFYLGLSGLILAPFFEEIIFRYYIFGGLLKKYSFLTALLTSSILFSLIHIDSPRNLIPTFVLGLVSAIVYFRTQKIQYSILLHFMHNLLWFTTLVFASGYHQLIIKLGVGILFWISFLVGILLVILGLKTTTTTNNQFGKIRAKPAALRR